MRNYWGEISGQVKKQPANAVTWDVDVNQVTIEIKSGAYDDATLSSINRNIRVECFGTWELDIRDYGIKEGYSLVDRIVIPEFYIEVTTFSSNGGRDKREDILVPETFLDAQYSGDTEMEFMGNWFEGELNITSVFLVVDFSSGKPVVSLDANLSGFNWGK